MAKATGQDPRIVSTAFNAPDHQLGQPHTTGAGTGPAKFGGEIVS